MHRRPRLASKVRSWLIRYTASLRYFQSGDAFFVTLAALLIMGAAAINIPLFI